MKFRAIPKHSMTLLATLVASSAFVVSCGGGGATSGSQAATPRTAIAASAAAPAGEAASIAASAVTAAASGASEPSVEAAAGSKNGEGASTHRVGSATSADGSIAAAASAAPPKSPTTLPAASTSTEQTPAGSSSTSGSTGEQVAAVTLTPVEAQATAAPAPLALQQRMDRLKAAIDSMKVAKHEALPACAPCHGWGVKPLVVMGTEPYASALPPNWAGLRAADWKGMGSWFVIYAGTKGNTATNTAVEVSGIELWYFSKTTKTWRLVQSAPRPKWDTAVGPDTVSLNAPPVVRVVGSESISYVPTATSVAHGGLPLTETPWNNATNKSDIDAIYLAVRHRLALRDPTGVDDRANANYVLNAGVDYMPSMFTRVRDLNATYAPGAGQGQYIKVTPQWRHSTLFLKSSSISEAQILSAAPPTFLY